MKWKRVPLAWSRAVALWMVVAAAAGAATLVGYDWGTGDVWEWPLNRAIAYLSMMAAGYVALALILVGGDDK